jgi:hypothetical protein
MVVSQLGNPVVVRGRRRSVGSAPVIAVGAVGAVGAGGSRTVAIYRSPGTAADSAELVNVT